MTHVLRLPSSCNNFNINLIHALNHSMQYDWLSWYYEMYDLYVIQDKTLPFVVEHFKKKGFTPRYVEEHHSLQWKTLC